jgi:hypothetical protein
MFSAAIKSGAAGSPKDPQFNYVTMLLHGDGSASGNTTVTPFNADASTNNFNVAINGDARSNNFTPYQAGYYSSYFDGSGDYLSGPSNAVFATGTNSFTIEGWVYLTGSTFGSIISTWNSTSGTNGVILGVTSSNYAQFSIGNGGGSSDDILSSSTIPLNTWTHVAGVRNGNALTLYINGASVGTGTTTRSIGQQVPYIGAYYANTPLSNCLTGYISNARFTSSAVYTSVFTPSTTPLTAITNTQLLTCQSNRFIDNSTNAFAITATGNTAIAPAQPFTLPSSVATYGSGYFDGSADYLATPTGQTSLTLSTSDFTIEMWAYPTTQVRGNPSLFTSDPAIGLANTIMVQFGGTSGQTTLWVNNVNLTSSSTTNYIKLNQWNHVAICRTSGNSYSFYINGVAVNNIATNSTSLTTNNWYIGYWTVADNAYTGNITDFRIVKGTAVYTAAFTPPIAPLTAITNTSLLTTQYNGAGNNNGFKDSSLNNFPITRNGNTTQGTFTPYGSNWSAYFNGSNGSKVDLASAPLPATGAFTFECFIFPLSFSALMIVYSQYNSSNTNRWYIGTNTDGTVVMGGNTLPALTSTTALTLNAWNYFAVTRDGSGNGKVFINGVLSNSNTGWTTTLDTVNPRISGFANPSELCVNGYLSNIRITNTNLYTASFAVPKSPLTAVSGTTLLTLQDNRYKDNSASAITLTPASTSIQRFSQFIPTLPYSSTTIGGSAYFDGTGDWLTAPNNTAFDFGSDNFTLEAMIFPLTSTPSSTIFGKRASGAVYGPFNFGFGGSLNLGYLTSFNGSSWGVNISSSVACVANAWNHIAVTRNGSTFTIWVNGVSGATASNASAVMTNTSAVSIGATAADGTSPFNGYITDARIVKGTAVYTSAFTPPTAPLTPTSSTQLLLSNTNAAIFDNAMMNDLETVGNAQVSTSVKKFGNASMYFDGSGDYLNQPSSPNFGLSGNFTVEAWVYLTANIANAVGGYLTDFRGGSTNNFALGFIGNGGVTKMYEFIGSTGASTTGSATVTLNTWNHVAWVRNGSTVTMYLNGTANGTMTSSFVQGSTNVTIASRYTGATEYITGYIDDLRITNGVARYTTTFTPPTVAFPNN